jgi:hypothetical protein
MACLKTSEGFSRYPRYARARDVDNRQGLPRSSDAPVGGRIGFAAALRANASVARSARFSAIRGDCMSGRRSRSKGARTERGIVNALRASGVAAGVPRSGPVGSRIASVVA